MARKAVVTSQIDNRRLPVVENIVPDTDSRRVAARIVIWDSYAADFLKNVLFNDIIVRSPDPYAVDAILGGPQRQPTDSDV